MIKSLLDCWIGNEATVTQFIPTLKRWGLPGSTEENSMTDPGSNIYMLLQIVQQMIDKSIAQMMTGEPR